MHTVSLGVAGISPELWTRITHVDRENGVATMEVKIDNDTSVTVRLNKYGMHPVDRRDEWNKFVKVDGEAKLRSVQMIPEQLANGKVELLLWQVELTYGMFAYVND